MSCSRTQRSDADEALGCGFEPRQHQIHTASLAQHKVGKPLHSVGPDLGPNCLQWLSAGDKTSPA